MQPESVIDESLDISKLKVPDLKRELKLRGLSSTGNKNELMERLQEALKAKTEDAASATSVDELEEDLLNGDDDEHLDSTESVITDIDTANEVIQKGIKRKSTEKESEEELPKPAKKIVLKRNSSHTEETSQPELVEIKILEKAEKKVIKLSEIGAKERLEMRAKKFGVPITVNIKKAVRAERFNDARLSNKKEINLDVNVLKKRAERFGQSVSTVMTTLEIDEKLEKRKERFGIASNGSVPQNDKAKQRLERFKQPVK